MAFAKSQIGAGVNIPLKGKVFISVMNKDKRSIVFLAKKLVDLGFEMVATKGTAKVLANNGILSKPYLKSVKADRILSIKLKTEKFIWSSILRVGRNQGR